MTRLQASVLLAGLAAALTAAPTAAGEEVVIHDAEGRPTVLYRASHALVIGAADYEHDASWNDLPRVRYEVDEVAAALRRDGFEVEIVSDPTGDELRDSIHRFVVRYGYGGANSDNRLLVFFSGHGHTRPIERGYLVPVDAPDPVLDEQSFVDKALDMIDVMGWAQKIEAKHALFVFDSCFSGTVFETRARPRLGEAYVRASTGKPTRQFITAGDAGQEVPPQSIFTPVFIEALEGAADANGDRYITGVELGLYLMQTVPDYNPAQTPQYGKIRDPRLDDGDFIFRAREPPPTPEFALREPEQEQEEVRSAPAAPLTSQNPLTRRAALTPRDAPAYVAPSTWERTYGGADKKEEAVAVAATADGGGLVAGHFSSEKGWLWKTFDRGTWVLRLDAQGEVLWERAYGRFHPLQGVGAEDEYWNEPAAMAATAAGGYIIAGMREQPRVPAPGANFGGGHITGWIVRLDALGEVLWERTPAISVGAVTATADGGAVAVGGAAEKMVLKLDAQGEVEWDRRFGRAHEAGEQTRSDGRRYGTDHAVAVMADGGYLVAGSTGPIGSATEDSYMFNASTMKLDAQGTAVWERIHDHGDGSSDRVSAVVAMADGGAVVAGTTSKKDGPGQAWVLKLDPQGEVLWELTRDRDASFGKGPALAATADGGTVVAGDVGGDAWLLKLDAQGEVLWERTHDRRHGSMSDGTAAVAATSDGGYLVAGDTAFDVWVLKLSAEGKLKLPPTSALATPQAEGGLD